MPCAVFFAGSGRGLNEHVVVTGQGFADLLGCGVQGHGLAVVAGIEKGIVEIVIGHTVFHQLAGPHA